jgi:hypothetical protein
MSTSSSSPQPASRCLPSRPQEDDLGARGQFLLSEFIHTSFFVVDILNFRQMPRLKSGYCRPSAPDLQNASPGLRGSSHSRHRIITRFLKPLQAGGSSPGLPHLQGCTGPKWRSLAGRPRPGNLGRNVEMSKYRTIHEGLPIFLTFNPNASFKSRYWCRGKNLFCGHVGRG